MRLLAIIFFTITQSVYGQNADCRQTWMPQDAPAFCEWQIETPLPEARTYHAVAMSGPHIYVLGGYRFDASSAKTIYYDSVIKSTIDANGRLGQWQAEPSFMDGRSGAAVIRAGNCIFLNGGSSSTPSSLIYYDDTQYAQIGKDGHLTRWIRSSSRLRTPRSNHSLVVVTTGQGTFLNAIAGVTQMGQDTVHLDTIEFAKIEDNCEVGPWATANYHIKGGRSTPQALAVRDKIVVIGGWGDLDLIDVFNDLQVAPVRSDGSPGPWQTSATRLGTGIYGHATIVADSELHPEISLLLSIGGQPGVGAYAAWISYVYFSSSVALPGTIGIWRIAPTGELPTGRAGLALAQSRERLYVIGGNAGRGQYYSDVMSARFEPGLPK